MIKKIRKFTNMNVLCITDDKKLITDMQEKCYDAKSLLFLDNIPSLVSENKLFDIVLIDYSLKIALSILKEMKSIQPMLPKIIILKENTERNLLDCVNYGAYAVLSDPINFEDLRLSMIMALNQSKRVDKIALDKGIYYDSYRERFYDSNGAINFTRFEFDLLKLLLDNHTRIVSYDEIKENVWKEKKMSIFTMRNVVNKIRNKTYYEIIKNNSSSGYQIDKIR